MIAVDTSSLRRFLSGERGADVDRVAEAIENRSIVLPPIVLSEILSDRATSSLEEVLSSLPLLAITDGYWVRAGLLRSRVIVKGHKSRVADALIAQICLDHSTPLISHDRDFKHFVAEGLVLL